MDDIRNEAARLLLHWSDAVRASESERIERELDEAVRQTFPCSDPIAATVLHERASAVGAETLATLTLRCDPAERVRRARGELLRDEPIAALEVTLRFKAENAVAPSPRDRPTDPSIPPTESSAGARSSAKR